MGLFGAPPFWLGLAAATATAMSQFAFGVFLMVVVRRGDRGLGFHPGLGRKLHCLLTTTFF